LWKTQSQSLGRWFAGVVLFAAVILFRVVEPYTKASDELLSKKVQHQEKLAEQATEKRKLRALKGLVDRVKNVYESVGQAPWRGSIESLREEFNELGKSYELLSRSNPAGIAHALEAAARAEAERRRELRLQAETPSPASQFAPVHQFPTAREDPTAAITESDQEHLARLRRPLADRPDDTLSRGALSRSDRSELRVLETERRRRPAERVEILRAAAAKALRLDRETLNGLSSAEEFKKLLGRAVQQVAQDRADATISDIATMIDRKITTPVSQLVQMAAAQGVPAEGLLSTVQNLKAGMGAWRDSLLPDEEWYRTVSAKMSIVDGLKQELDNYQREFQSAAGGQREEVRQKADELGGRVTAIQNEVAGLERETKRLSGVLEKSLPEWLQGEISPQDMIQLYPGVLLLLIGFLALKAHNVRKSYRTVRDELYPQGEHRQNPALSSVWTLVQRGRSGTALTGTVFGGGALLFWWFFERGSSQALSWIPAHPQETWNNALPWIGRLLPVGRIFFAASAIAVVVLLLRDCRNRG
jgi:hypothetical protein